MKDQFSEGKDAAIYIKDNIIFYAFSKEVIDLESAKDSVELRINIAKSNAYPIFVDISRVKSVTKEARDYLATGKAIENISAAALLAGSFVSKMIGTFFLTFNNPGVPVKLFTDRQDAVKWLGKYTGGNAKGTPVL